MRKLLVCLFMLLLAPVYAAQIVNVEYIHNAIAQKWDITVPYNKSLTNPRVAANMKYLLTTIDVANEMLNGSQVTTYGSGQYATLVAADTIATNNAVEQLIKQSIVYPFTATTAIDTTEFEFRIRSAGEFYIDWGDGSTEVVTKTDASTQELSHNYDTAGMYKIKLAGKATGYNSTDLWGAIAFSHETDLVAIDGCLGCIFSTLSDNTQPRFRATFSGTSITSIPEGLFAGVHGAPVEYMFDESFSGTSITSIPEGLFSGISGAPAQGMFKGTFRGTGITSIPEGLFSGISGTPVYRMFSETFKDCSKLTGIPLGVFGDLTKGAYCANEVFDYTFGGCSSLTGPSARMPDGTYLYDYFSSCPSLFALKMYSGAIGLSDYANIPSGWVIGLEVPFVPPLPPSF